MEEEKEDPAEQPETTTATSYDEDLGEVDGGRGVDLEASISEEEDIPPEQRQPQQVSDLGGGLNEEESVTLQMEKIAEQRKANAHLTEPAYPQGIFGPQSLSVVAATVRTHDSIATTTERLFRNNKKIKQEKTANDALLSSLPTDSLRWIKKRRKINSNEKVALTHFRERQLRDMFRGLDFDGMGTIHLDLVVDAANYAEEKMRPKKGKAVFTNIKGMFLAMDEDGDGTVDFREFTVAMTGSSKSAMDNASESDVEKLAARFIEFANMRQRELAVQLVNFPLSKVEEMKRAQSPKEGSSKTLRPTSPSPFAGAATATRMTITKALPPIVDTQPDLDRYQHFRTLFAYGTKTDGETVETIESVVEKAQKSMAGTTNKKSNKEKLIDDFYDEMKCVRTEELIEIEKSGDEELLAAKRTRDAKIEEVQKKIRDLRIKTDDEVEHDPEMRELYNRIREEKRYIAEMKKCTWLPQEEIPTSVIGKPTLVPILASPTKRQVHAKLHAMATFKRVRPKSPDAVNRNGLRVSKSLGSLHLHSPVSRCGDFAGNSGVKMHHPRGTDDVRIKSYRIIPFVPLSRKKVC